MLNISILIDHNRYHNVGVFVRRSELYDQDCRIKFVVNVAGRSTEEEKCLSGRQIDRLTRID